MAKMGKWNNAPENGIVDAENGIVDAENGIMVVENGIVDAENGIVDAENGIMPPENGIVGAENGIVDAENGIMVAENGIVGWWQGSRKIPLSLSMDFWYNSSRLSGKPPRGESAAEQRRNWSLGPVTTNRIERKRQ